MYHEAGAAQRLAGDLFISWVAVAQPHEPPEAVSLINVGTVYCIDAEHHDITGISGTGHRVFKAPFVGRQMRRATFSIHLRDVLAMSFFVTAGHETQTAVLIVGVVEVNDGINVPETLMLIEW